eukprot:TRINITY_DN19433_c0_g1_i2.p1 TRINITY_DN19433_c0_g1~~TRINITY_DN19433_c0_g1_i2.p1  ORF type:complete len:366 (+),score=94.79 TRINITY_DN19433_c0_g1_i2:293-1390(+)
MSGGEDGWDQDFGPRIDLGARIREILQIYPEGNAILKELLQNADDAGARVVRFCLDKRQHETDALAYPELAQFQGPALCAFNDAIFTETDFTSIQHIGDSRKKESVVKTGRFGVGFNSVYHLTDLPSFVSGERLVFFDPHAKFLPVTAANPGKMLRLPGNPALTKVPHTFEPYAIFGHQPGEPFGGTIFRLPLRTSDQARSSRLSTNLYTPHRVVHELFESFMAEAGAMVLFLKSLEMVELLVWEPDASAPVLLHSVSVSSPNPQASLRDERCAVLGIVERAKAAREYPDAPLELEPYLSCFRIEIRIESQSGEHHTESWLVAHGLGSNQAMRMATDPRLARLNLLPWGGVAARVDKVGSNPTPR